MRSLFILATCALVAAGGIAGDARALELYGVPAVEKVLRDEEPSSNWSPGAMAIECAGNEWEAFQVVVRASSAGEATMELSPFVGPEGHAIPPENVRLYRVEWVDVNAPYAVDETSENPDLRPDPLVPLAHPEARIAVQPGRNTVLWFSVYVAEGTPAGEYTGAVTFRTEAGGAKQLAVSLRAYGFALPRRPILQSMIGLAAANIFRAHGCKTPEEREQIIRLYFDEYIRARLSPFLYAPGTAAFSPLPGAQIKWRFAKDAEGNPTGEVTLDFEGFDREAERYFDQRDAFSAFNFAPYLWIRREEDGKREIVLRFTDTHGTAVLREGPDGKVNPVFDRLVVRVFRAIGTHLAEKGWLDRAIYYVTDEPYDSDTPAIEQICKLVREADPRIRTSLTYDPAMRPSLAKLLDDDGQSLISVWIPYCSYYREEVAADQRGKGADYWLYDVKDTCLISHTGRQNRGIFWEIWDRDAHGYLYYLSTYWGRDATPWLRPNFLLPGVAYRYRHGDGYFFYPPTVDGSPEEPILDHVVPTIRWELMREGAEDYDYLRMLQRLTERAEAAGRAEAAQGREALRKAGALAASVATPTNNYAIRDLQLELKEGWTAGLEEGWLHHRGGRASDLPIRIPTELPDGLYQLVLSVYDARDHRGLPYSRFLVGGKPYASPGSGVNGPVTVEAGTAEVRDGVCSFTLSSLPEPCGVIVYRVGLKRTESRISAGLYETRSEVTRAIEALTKAVAE